MKFLKEFKAAQGGPYLEDSVMWYCLQSPEFYLSLTINQKIQYKQSYFEYDTDYPW